MLLNAASNIGLANMVMCRKRGGSIKVHSKKSHAPKKPRFGGGSGMPAVMPPEGSPAEEASESPQQEAMEQAQGPAGMPGGMPAGAPGEGAGGPGVGAPAGMKRGGKVKGYASGGAVSDAGKTQSRGGGKATRGTGYKVC